MNSTHMHSSARRWCTKVAAMVVLGLLSTAPAARATSCFSPMVRAQTLPVDGATHVATDGLIWVLPMSTQSGEALVYEDDAEEALELQDASGAVVPTTFSVVWAGGHSDTVHTWRVLYLLRPDAPLIPGASYALVDRDGEILDDRTPRTFSVVDREARGDIPLFARLAPGAPDEAAWQTVADLDGSPHVLGFFPAASWSSKEREVEVLTFDAAGAVLGEDLVTVERKPLPGSAGGCSSEGCTQARGTWLGGAMAIVWLVWARRRGAFSAGARCERVRAGRRLGLGRMR